MREHGSDVDDVILVAVRRVDALDALSDGPLRRAELEEAIGVSRTTAHRIVRALAEHGLARRTDGRHELTSFGEVVAVEVSRVRGSVGAARSLGPFIDALAGTPFEIDVSRFTGATVTTAGPGDPYAPVSRFMELLVETDVLRGFDTTSIAPIYVDEIRAEILGGMRTSIVYLPEVAERIASAYPGKLRASLESGRLELFTSEELPFGLALFDGRIGLGAYDGETGMLSCFVDTDDPDAILWGETLYEHYRDAATRYEPS